MKKITRNIKNIKRQKKAISAPIIYNTIEESFFQTQKTSLESLIYLIKLNQVNFFSIPNKSNDNNFIIEFLSDFKHALSNSLNNQKQQKEQILKEVKIYFLFTNSMNFI